MALLPPGSGPRNRSPQLLGAPGKCPQPLPLTASEPRSRTRASFDELPPQPQPRARTRVSFDEPAPTSQGSVVRAARAKAAPGPFGEGTTIHVCIHGACINGGSAALLSDLEELVVYTKVKVASRGCLGLCGKGPNCLLEPADPNGKNGLEPGVKKFADIKNLIQKAAGSTEVKIPEPVLLRSRLKSDAMRLVISCAARDSSEVLQDMRKAEALLTEAIALEKKEITASRAASSAVRLRELHMLRGKAFGRCVLADAERRLEHGQRAIAEFEIVIARDASFAPAYAESARVYSFLQNFKDAVNNYKIALDIKKGQGVPLTYEDAARSKRHMAKLQTRLDRGESGAIAASDSGDGSGIWKVLEIVSLSRDSCIYQLGNTQPGQDHPYQHHLWHVQVHAEGEMREYTPVSTAAQWEAGRLDLLVKTYPDGKVSKWFGTLRSFEQAHERSQMNYTSIEEEPCWVHVSAPMLTLSLPMSMSRKILQLVIVVGGTGIAPAFQLLSNVSNLDSGFDVGCKVVLLYSSSTSIDVLMLDQLRDLEEALSGRIKIQHFLTNEPDEEDGDPWDVLPMIKSFRGRHDHFASSWNPFEPREGVLRIGVGEEAEKGRIDIDVLRRFLSPPSSSARVVLCGPQGFMESVRGNLIALSYAQETIIELQASPTPATSAGHRGSEGAVNQPFHKSIMRSGESFQSHLPFPKAGVEKKIEAPRAMQTLTFADRVIDTVQQNAIHPKSVASSRCVN